MKRKIWISLALVLGLVLCAAGALAADVFKFESKSIDIFEGDTAQAVLVREGNPAGEGTITFSSAKAGIAAVTSEGVISGVKKGQTTIKATFSNGKRTWNASLTVRVIRRVTNVTLNTAKLTVYQPGDAALNGLMQAEIGGGDTDEGGEPGEEETPEYAGVLVVAAGKSIELKAACTPSDANNRRVVFTSTDEGVLKPGSSSARALQAGECDLTVASVQNPEIFEIYHVMVTQPVTKITLSSAAGKTVSVGETLSLQAEILPLNATTRSLSWSSRNGQIATVDEDGVVTGWKKGTVTIEAKAADGSGKSATIQITVAQMATGISIQESELTLATTQMKYLHATVTPSDANDKGVLWSSSDTSIATVTSGGQVKGIRRGECEITATSKSNPDVSASLTVQVVQRVTTINFLDSQVSLPIRTTAQLSWEVLPLDATIQDVTFASSNRNVATVDENGLVTGISRGTSTITATATDGSKRRGQIRVTVTQPVEGVSIQYGVYHIQTEGYLNIKAIITPSNANNQNVHFSMGDESIATVTDQKNIGRVRALRAGNTTITAETEDGGYTASAEVRVADFNRAVVIDDLYIDGKNNIRITLRNRGDFTTDRVYFTVEAFDRNGLPLVCNVDGESTSFQGSYRLELGPDERTEHYEFDFGDFAQPLYQIGMVNVTITGWRDTEGYTRNIPAEDQPTQSYRRYIPESDQDVEELD